MSGHGRASFAPQDSADAKRGHPEGDLRGYAAQRGLEFLDHATPGGYRAAVPCEEELQFNVLRGALPGGEYGVVAHENLQIGWSENRSDWSGGLTALFHRFERFAFGWDCQLDRHLDEVLDHGIDAVYSDHVDRMTDALGRAHPA